MVYAISSHCYYRSHIESYMWLGLLNSAILMTLSDVQVHSVIKSVFESNAVYSYSCAAINLECHAVPLQLLSLSILHRIARSTFNFCHNYLLLIISSLKIIAKQLLCRFVPRWCVLQLCAMRCNHINGGPTVNPLCLLSNSAKISATCCSVVGTLLLSLPVKAFWTSVGIWRSYMQAGVQ